MLKHKNGEKAAREKAFDAKGAYKAAEDKSQYADKAWTVAKDLLKQKVVDAKKMRKEIKSMYISGLKQKNGEICMLRKIECMVAKFNNEKDNEAKYCKTCTEDNAS